MLEKMFHGFSFKHLAVLFLLTSGTLYTVNASADSLPPLDAEFQKALSAIEFDPPPKKLTKDFHFVVSDERRHDLFRPRIDKKGGVFVGIGTNQNFAMAAWARAEIMVLVDFDQMVVDTHSMYRVAFHVAPDYDSFLELFSKKGVKAFRKQISDYYKEDSARRKASLAALRFGRWRIYQRLGEVKSIYTRKSLSIFLNNKEEYDYVRMLWGAGRVFAYRGDLTKTKVLQQLGAVLAKFGQKIGVFYLSNAEQYFGYGKNYRTNMSVLPTTKDSEVIRTYGWRPRNEAGEKVGRVNYIYITQQYEQFKEWLKSPKTKTMRSMFPRPFRLRNEHYRIEHLPGEKAKPAKSSRRTRL